MTIKNYTIPELLSENNIPYTDGPKYIRIPSPGKDMKNRSCSIAKDSGRVFDFVSNESMTLEEYLDLIGIKSKNLNISLQEVANDDTPSRILKAKKLWEVSKQLNTKSPSYRYFINRGIPEQEINWMINNDIVREFVDKSGKCAVVLPIIENGWGDSVTGVQRIYITKEGFKDETNGPAKKMFGVHGSGGMVIPADSTIGKKGDRVILAIVEGPETGAAIHSALTLEARLRCEVFVAFDTGGVKKGLKATDLYAIKTFKDSIDVVIFQDHDLEIIVKSKDKTTGEEKTKIKPAPGQLAADQLTEKLRSSGWSVKIADPPPLVSGPDHKRDWLDVYNKNPQDIIDTVYTLLPKYKKFSDLKLMNNPGNNFFLGRDR